MRTSPGPFPRQADSKPAAMVVMLPNMNEAARDLNGRRLLPLEWLKLLWHLKRHMLRPGRSARHRRG